MTQPPSDQWYDPDEAQGVTQEANFPLAWIKDYNPQIHGIRPQAKIQQLQQPPAHFQQPVLPANQPPRNQPAVPPSTQPPVAASYRPAVPPAYQPPLQAPLNQVATFGGQPEKKASFFPWWGWAIIAVLVLLVVAEASFIAFR